MSLSSLRNLLSLLLISFSSLHAQTVWNLQSCIDHALENSIAIKQSKLNTSYAENTLLQSRMNMYSPIVNSDISHSFNFSASVDPLTFDFIRQNTQSTRMGISGQYSLFEGLNRYHTAKANEDLLDATSYEVMELENNTKLTIANYYLQILVANEVLQVANERLNLTNLQLNNTEKLVQSGVRANGDLLEVESQKANDELAIVNAENTLERALNQLKILLQLDPYEVITVEGIDVSTTQIGTYNPQFVSSRAFDLMPNLKGSELRRMAAEKQLKAAKGLLSPTLSLTGYVGTNYFSAARDVLGESSLGRVPIGTVNGSNEIVTSLTEFTSPIFGDLSFGQQFSKNINQNLALNLSIPLFGKWQRMIAIQNAKVNVEQANYNIESKENELQQTILNAYTDMKGAAKKLEASQKSLNAASQAFDYGNKKFQAGLMNTLEFETVKNRYVAAQADVIQSKYEFAFMQMIVNFYQTGNIQL